MPKSLFRNSFKNSFNMVKNLVITEKSFLHIFKLKLIRLQTTFILLIEHAAMRTDFYLCLKRLKHFFFIETKVIHNPRTDLGHSL